MQQHRLIRKFIPSEALTRAGAGGGSIISGRKNEKARKERKRERESARPHLNISFGTGDKLKL